MGFVKTAGEMKAKKRETADYRRPYVWLMAFFVLTWFQLPKASHGDSLPKPLKILVVMTNHSHYPNRSDSTGLWLTELTHFYDIAGNAGYEMDFVSPKGGEVPLDQRSLGWLYMDKSARGHLNDPDFMKRLKHTKAAADVDPAEYRAIYYTGGHGVMWDYRGNPELKKLGESIYRQGGIVSSVCHGGAGLLDLEDENGKPLISGRRVAGFSNAEETLSGLKDQVPFLLENELKARGALFEKAFFPFTSFAVRDGRIVTGQNPMSSKAVADLLVTVLSDDHRQ
jgi:putative intracellular protease/amidase